MTGTNDATIALVAKALEMEERGKAFYQDALEKCSNPLGRDIFAKLKSDEDVHVARIKAIHEALAGGQGWSDEWKTVDLEGGDVKQVFRELAAKYKTEIHATTDDIQAVQMGMDFEKKAVDFYRAELERATDPMEKEFAELMVQEERSHYSTLSDIKFYLENPEAWFEQHERSQLDGA